MAKQKREESIRVRTVKGEFRIPAWESALPLMKEILDPFGPLKQVFDQALAQTQTGKGKARHNQRNEPFTDQQIVRFGDWMGTNHFQVGQAVKKAIESTKLPKDRARAELLGAIVYLGAAVICLDRQPVADPFVRATDPIKETK